MKIKTILTILLTAIITITLIQNSETIFMKFLWFDFQISKLMLISTVFFVGLIVGLLWAAPKKKVESEEDETSNLEESDKNWLN